MAEHRPSAPFDDTELRERLSRFASAGAAATLHDPVPGVSTIRARAQRRRTALAAVSALAVAVVSVGVASAGGWGGEQAAPNPASPSPVVTTTPAPSESPTPDPTVAPTTPSTTTEAPAREIPTTIPDDMRLPNEGGTANGGNYQWVPGEPSGHLCGDASVPELPAYRFVTDSRYIEVLGEEWYESEALLVLENADAAVALMGEIRSAAKACPPVDDPDALSVARVDPLDGAWGEGSLISTGYRFEGAPPDYYISGGNMAVIRLGSAVMMASVGGEGWGGLSQDRTPLAGNVTYLRESLDEIAPELCAFTQAGC